MKILNDMQSNKEILSFEPAVHQPELFKAWSVFIQTGRIERDVVPPHIATSWIKSRKSGVDPYVFSPDAYLPENQYKKRIIQNKELIETARPIMENVYQSLEQTKYLVVLYDSDGYHLLRIGQRADFERSKKFKIREGLCFDDQHIGTCGFSLVKQLQKALQITGCEHYSKSLHYVTGAYAPIFSLKSKKLIGVIGVTGAKTLPNLHTLGIVIAVRTAIEKLIEIRETNEALLIYGKVLSLMMNSFNDGVLYIDKAGQMLHYNFAAEKILGINRADIEAINIEDLRKLSLLEGFIKCISPFDIQKEKEVQCEIDSQLFTVTIKPLKINNEMEGLFVQIRNIKNLSKMLHNLTSDHAEYTFSSLVGSSSQITEVKKNGENAARSGISVIIEGESGTGKEILAQAIHNASNRNKMPFIAINCAAIPAELFESTLFGHEKGAFSGATSIQIGKYELADGGTLFLDEIAELPLLMQAKMLRVIESCRIDRIGGKKSIPVNVKILAATNKNLYTMVKDNKFRSDFYYRLNVFRIVIPALRERKDDIIDLVDHFIKILAPLYNKHDMRLSESCLDLFLDYDWPGNVRELKNAIQYAIIKEDAEIFLPEHFQGFFHNYNHQAQVPPSRKNEEKLVEVEKQLIFKVLKKNQGNKSKAAKVLGIGRATLYRKLKEMSAKNGLF